MRTITDLKNAQKDYKFPVQGNLKTSSVPVKTEPMPQDSVEISNKKNTEGANGFGKIAGVLAGLALLVGAGTLGGVKLYDKYFQRLACGIKKGEINDALYNFIKKNDPKGKLFSGKDEIITINEKLTDEKFLILKQLAKMKDENPMGIYNYRSRGLFNSRSRDIYNSTPRFTLNQITNLLSNTNEFNLKYLEQLAKKTITNKYGEKRTIDTHDMLKILKNITPDNEKVTGELIEITNIDKPYELVNCLKNINKKNIDIYQMLLSTRKKGGKTELSIRDIDFVASKLERTKNLNCAELFLNAEKSNGTGQFRYSIEEVRDLLDIAQEEKYDIYKKLYDLKCTKDLDSKMHSLVKTVTDDNIDLIEPLLTKKYKSELMSQYVIFDDWDKIENILDSVNSKNKDVVKRIINIVDDRKFKQTNDIWSQSYVDAYLPNLFNELSYNPASLKRAEQILNNGVVDGKQTLDFQKFYDSYLDIKNTRNKYYEF